MRIVMSMEFTLMMMVCKEFSARMMAVCKVVCKVVCKEAALQTKVQTISSTL